MAEVYGLHRESDKKIMYIGWTSKTSAIRFKGHNDSKRRGSQTPVYVWMREYDDITFTVLESGLTDEEAREKEIELIASYGIDNLLNVSTGGNGSPGFKHTDEFKKAVSQRHSGKFVSEETRRRISESNLGRKKRPRTEEEKLNLSIKLTGRIVSEETRKRQSQALKGRTFSEETLARMSAGQKRRFENIEEREKYSKMFLGKPRAGKKKIEPNEVEDGA